MRGVADQSELSLRADRVRRATLGAALIASCLAGVAILMVDWRSSITDVHIPYEHLDLLKTSGGTVPDREAHVVDRGLGPAGQLVAWILQLSTPCGIVLLVWSLCKRRGSMTFVTMIWLAVAYFTGPIPNTIHPTRPSAVSVAVARNILHTGGPAKAEWASDPADWRRYMLAQIAYTEGDRAIATKIATGLQPDDLGPPLEARYRLALLQGGEPAPILPWCRINCLSPTVRTIGASLAITVVLLAIGTSVLSALAFRTIRRRLATIDALRTTGLLRRGGAIVSIRP